MQSYFPLLICFPTEKWRAVICRVEREEWSLECSVGTWCSLECQDVIMTDTATPLLSISPTSGCCPDHPGHQGGLHHPVQSFHLSAGQVRNAKTILSVLPLFPQQSGRPSVAGGGQAATRRRSVRKYLLLLSSSQFSVSLAGR